MSNVRKTRDSATELRFAHPHARGWIAVVLGGAGAWLAWTRIDPGAGAARWAVVGFALLILLMGVWSVLYRLELTIDLARGRVRWKRGTVWKTETGDGALADTIEAVVLREDLDRKGTEKVTDEWEVKLRIRDWAQRVEVFESKEEAPARAEAEKLAERLGVPLEEEREL